MTSPDGQRSADFNPAALRAGAATVDITPPGSVFLFGYPHVPRFSTGVHDRLECTAFYLEADSGRALFISNDLIFFDRDYVSGIRRRILEATGLPPEAVMISATHTHSGPVMTNNLSNAADSVVPEADPTYLRWVADRMLLAAQTAIAVAQPAELGLVAARAEGVGSNRHVASGPADPEVPVLVARSLATRRPVGCMVVYGMHPTVLHEDSTLISADFPGFTRRWLQSQVLGPGCPVVYHLGVAGNQSPRHMTRANTFAEAQRIGELLARTISVALDSIAYGPVGSIVAGRSMLDVRTRVFPTAEAARDALAQSRARFEELRAANAPRQEVRTAECDVFGAEKTALLAGAVADGRLAESARSASPAEIQVIRIGDWRFVAWPGEFFVEHGLALKARAPRGTYVVTLANGQLQGYIATPEAVARGYYEATNAIFSADNGPRFVEETLALLARMH